MTFDAFTPVIRTTIIATLFCILDKFIKSKLSQNSTPYQLSTLYYYILRTMVNIYFVSNEMLQ